MDMLSILTAFGLGTIVTVLVQALLAHWSRRGERSFREKKAAYLGLLDAYRRVAVEGTDVARKNFAYWQLRCELVAPEAVRRAIERIIETDSFSPARNEAHEDLKVALRADYGITR